MESNGVLRVISQPGVWDTSAPPVLQTFAIQSSDAATRLAAIDVQLPAPERLRSVRFDGTRAFAITAVQTDPLFTFDLSDPADPKQLGELEMPGWVYHMEPRGDRLLALGFDNANAQGSLHVSIFDVSDLTTPTLLSRVNFGSDWAYLAEDQDRIHKAFNLLEPEGLILVPFSGYDYGVDYEYCGSYVSGVQLIDWSRDSLTRRGVVPSVGQARRAFLLNQRLFTVSDDRVESFDYADRDAPSRTAKVSLARRVSKSAIVGDHMLRLGASWWSDNTTLDVVETSKAEQAASLGEVDIENQVATAGCSYGVGSPKLFSHGNFAYVVYSNYDYYYYDAQSSAVAIVDVSNPAEPKVVKQYTLKAAGVQYWWEYGLNDVLPTGSDAVMVGSTLAVLRSTETYLSQGQAPRVTLEVADLADPNNPTSVTVALGETLGMTGLMVHAGKLFTSHYEPASDGRVRFYLDQIDISDPAHPKLSKRNVPGSLFAIDDQTGKVITTTYKRHEEHLATETQCWEQHGYYGHFRYDNQDYTGPGTCTWITHEFKLLDVSGSPRVESTLALDADMHPQNSVMGDGVLFAQLRDYNYSYDNLVNELELHTLSGFAEGKLKLGKVSAPSTDYYVYISDMAANGKHAAILTGQSFYVVDATNPAAPVVSQSERLIAYPESVSMDATHAYVSLGYDGVQSIPLE
ncbi:MAG: beta-propeller domain-containing protein [Polyangiaceae bacterium]